MPDAPARQLYEAYKEIDKAGRFMAKAGLWAPPTSMEEYDARRGIARWRRTREVGRPVFPRSTPSGSKRPSASSVG